MFNFLWGLCLEQNILTELPNMLALSQELKMFVSLRAVVLTSEATHKTLTYEILQRDCGVNRRPGARRSLHFLTTEGKQRWRCWVTSGDWPKTWKITSFDCSQLYNQDRFVRYYHFKHKNVVKIIFVFRTTTTALLLGQCFLCSNVDTKVCQPRF